MVSLETWGIIRTCKVDPESMLHCSRWVCPFFPCFLLPPLLMNSGSSLKIYTYVYIHTHTHLKVCIQNYKYIYILECIYSIYSI